ncbi:gamma-glutamyl hydrolase B-like [Daktulosphaira vitifoliae]|uniref:gamma-glutamyl hydrolase B-like n=1 Tax=Daktulosphaira vitifoliae TaxID=58002 RepID=UPI0021AA434B|nr:gamma-glutamyl hydrolase B-like [Daktulosphaira vitifoliae]XP_050544523.1 gamma-glutamyl hydrolase B-like [Daktulosphaira vitifoliae]XP_050544525.1 gamma-glutamyl hydrolase B-like [Daktulosphaira vitifoliae]
MTLLIFSAILLLILQLSCCNKGPIVGILTQEIQWSCLINTHPDLPENTTYIASSYVKAVEASGGRVIPVFTNKTFEYYLDIVKKVNGILIPGGSCSFDTNSGITQSVCMIYKIAKKINDMHDHFPIFGICLGFELLLLCSNHGKTPLVMCNCEGMNMPLELIPGMEKKSVLFKKMPYDIKNILLNKPVTANHHHFCITRPVMSSTGLNKFWNTITINRDINDMEFISSIEAKNYPFVGLQFHPEKNAYEWERNDPHDWDAIYSARFFYDWFLNECRQNKHKYINEEELKAEIIYNYPETHVGNDTYAMFEQVYFFV